MRDKKSILMKFYNIYRTLYLKRFKLFSNILYRITMILFNCSIPPTCDLGEGVNFGHPIGIVIHQNSVIGKNTIIYQNVTIGRKESKTQEAPIIGENCIVGAGACILGKIKIGDNVKIGANAVVLQDIPDNCTVVGIPGKIIKRGKNE